MHTIGNAHHTPDPDTGFPSNGARTTARGKVAHYSLASYDSECQFAGTCYKDLCLPVARLLARLQKNKQHTPGLPEINCDHAAESLIPQHHLV